MDNIKCSQNFDRLIVSEIIALLDDFGHVCVSGHSIAVGTEIFDRKKPSTCQAGSNEVSFVHICSSVQELFAHKDKNLCSFIYIEIPNDYFEPKKREVTFMKNIGIQS